MAARKKDKKKKKEKAERENGQKQEVDAVKVFIAVMILLIFVLGAFIIHTSGQLDDYETALRRAKARSRPMGTKALEVKEYLKLIKEVGDRALLRYPERFFGHKYQEVGIAASQVTVGPKRNSMNRREKYTEIYWDLDVRDIDRKQATLFLHGVETESPKAQTIEISMRRTRKKRSDADATIEDQWTGRFKIGYRIAGTNR